MGAMNLKEIIKTNHVELKSRILVISLADMLTCATNERMRSSMKSENLDYFVMVDRVILQYGAAHEIKLLCLQQGFPSKQLV